MNREARSSRALSTTMERERVTKKAPTCNDGKYSKRTLQLAYELPFAGLFNKYNRGRQKYEASSVTIVNDDAYAICDGSWAISKFDSDFQPFSPNNIQIGDPNREEYEESGYEAIFYDKDIFYVVRESVEMLDESRRAQTYNAVIEELSIAGRDYEVLAACPSEFEFEGTSKGFEGAVAIRDVNNDLVVLGLCEGNYCSEERSKDNGNGRIIVMKKVIEDDSCKWSTIREIKIPSSANFHDYSDIALNEDGRVAITSQEDSQVWIGQLIGREDDGLWDIDALELSDEEAQVYDFPKNDKCKTVYCTIEGIEWMGAHMLLAVSDRMKSKGKQHFRCFEKDQSVHAFLIP